MRSASPATRSARDVYDRIKPTPEGVRRTVQADILKEIRPDYLHFLPFALRLLATCRITHERRAHSTVSISGSHRGSGANRSRSSRSRWRTASPTRVLSLARHALNQFGPNLLLLLNCVDPEYAVIGRVARRIGQGDESKYGRTEGQMLKYHIRRRVLVAAQEIAFTTSAPTAALYAIYDSCNSLHTNAYDGPHQAHRESCGSLWRSNYHHRLARARKTRPLQGSFIIEEPRSCQEAVLTGNSTAHVARVLGGWNQSKGKIQKSRSTTRH